MPVSATHSVKPSSALKSMKSVTEPRSVNLTAFDSRFSRICLMRPGSALMEGRFAAISTLMIAATAIVLVAAERWAGFHRFV